MNAEIFKLRKHHGFLENRNLWMITYPGFERLWIEPPTPEPEIQVKYSKNK